MKNQKELILEKSWENLLILDACRYDYFEEVYGNYLNGRLEKVRSPGSNTWEWCKEIFQGEYDDIVYVSGNPRINSRVRVRGFDAKEHFHEVIDVWDWGWDDELGTVPPDPVTKAFIKSKKDIPTKR